MKIQHTIMVGWGEKPLELLSDGHPCSVGEVVAGAVSRAVGVCTVARYFTLFTVDMITNKFFEMFE
jgi:hypothetical protein